MTDQTETCDICGEEHVINNKWFIANTNVKNHFMYFCNNCWDSDNLPGKTDKLTYKFKCTVCGKESVAYSDTTPFTRVSPGVFVCYAGGCYDKDGLQSNPVMHFMHTLRDLPINSMIAAKIQKAKDARKASWPARKTDWL